MLQKVIKVFSAVLITGVLGGAFVYANSLKTYKDKTIVLDLFKNIEVEDDINELKKLGEESKEKANDNLVETQEKVKKPVNLKDEDIEYNEEKKRS